MPAPAASIPGLGARDEVPRPNPRADALAAGLSPQEGWVLSRVDGHTSFADLLLITGLGEKETIEILRRLAARGLILTKNGRAATAPPPPAAAPSSPPVAAPARPVPAARTVPPSAAEMAQAARATGAAHADASAEAARTIAEAESRAEALGRAEAALRETEAALLSARAADETADRALAAAREALAAAEAEKSRAVARAAAAGAELADRKRTLAAAREAAQAAHAAARAADDRRQQAGDLEARTARKAGVPLPAPPKDRPRRPASQPDLRALLAAYATSVDEPAARAPAAAAPVPAEPAPPPEAAPLEVAAERSDVMAVDGAPGAGLPQELQKRILQKHERLAHADLFELLELPLLADKREIKRAYFRLSKEFHPDRHFGKDLGDLRSLLGDIFKALSQAADFLSDDERRADYERMIRNQHEMRDLESSLAQATQAALEEDRRLESEIEGAEGSGPTVDPTPASGRRVAEPQPRGVTPAGGAPRRPATVPPGPARERRLLRQMLGQRLSDERGARARRHYEEGLRQLEQGQWVSAAANLKLAATFAPQNAEYAERYAEAETEASALVAATHQRRGEIEERAGRFDTAARCYEQAAHLLPSFAAHLGAAEMFLKIRQLNKAQEHGIKAVELEPVQASGHLVLAQVFRETKQLPRARQSLDRALELDPQNQRARSLLKELQKLM